MSSFLLFEDDAVSHLQERYAASTINLIVTDPAYAALEKHRVVGTTTRLTGSWFDIFPDSRYPEFFQACYKALAKNAHLYVMSAADHDQIDVMVRAGRAAGFKFWKSIVWDKGRVGMGYHWRASHEVVLFFEKGKRKLNNLGWPDVIREPSLTGHGVTQAMLGAALDAYNAHAREAQKKYMYTPLTDEEEEEDDDELVLHGDAFPASLLASLEAALLEVQKDVPAVIAETSLRAKGLYPTEKPVGLWRRLIANSSDVGELVVDPFMGSGSSGEAALELGRCYAGSDISATAKALATDRLINFQRKAVP